jgi:non-heme chloroperoxidase
VGDRKGRLQEAETKEAVTEIVEMPNRGHSLTIDRGWQGVAETALAFVRRFT